MGHSACLPRRQPVVPAVLCVVQRARRPHLVRSEQRPSLLRVGAPRSAWGARRESRARREWRTRRVGGQELWSQKPGARSAALPSDALSSSQRTLSLPSCSVSSGSGARWRRRSGAGSSAPSASAAAPPVPPPPSEPAPPLPVPRPRSAPAPPPRSPAPPSLLRPLPSLLSASSRRWSRSRSSCGSCLLRRIGWRSSGRSRSPLTAGSTARARSGAGAAHGVAWRRTGRTRSGCASERMTMSQQSSAAARVHITVNARPARSSFSWTSPACIARSSLCCESRS